MGHIHGCQAALLADASYLGAHIPAQFGVEMSIAASKLKREEANAIVIRLLEKYESQIDTPPTGDRYQDCYDLTTGKPGEDYIRLYGEVKEELGGMGIPFD